MMGQQPRMESLFYYFRLEEQIPEDHLLRLIDRHGTLVGANASQQSRVRREQLAEVAQVSRTVGRHVAGKHQITVVGCWLWWAELRAHRRQ